MSRRIVTFLGILCFCIASLVGLSCTSVTDSSKSTYEYTKDKKSYFYRKDTLHLFYPTEGFQINFHGQRLCTLTTISANKSDTAQDIDSSLYYVRFTTNRDTFLLEGDTITGEAKFHQKDIKTNFNWDFLLKKFPDTLLLGKMLFDYLDDSMDQVMLSTDSGYKLTTAHKTAVITALNELINTDTLYNRYRTELNDYLWDTLFTQAVDRMVAENIWDTTGKLIGPLNTIQKQKVKRFNYNIFTKFFDTNFDELIFTPFPVLGRVFTIRVEKGESLQDLKIDMTKFYKVTDTVMTQLYYTDRDNKKIIPKNSKVNGYFIISGLKWDVTPIFMDFDLPLIPAADIPSIVNPGNAVIYFDTLEGSYENAVKYYRLINNYSITGQTVFEDGKAYYISGFICLEAGFINRSFGGTQYSIDNDRGYFTYMNIDIFFNAKSTSSKQYIYKEKRILETDSLRTRY